MFSEFLADNPDRLVPEYQTKCGIYEVGCGLENVLMSWGHDEYMYYIVKDDLPTEALYMIRYHSFYPAHREGAYAYLMNDRDRKYFRAVRAFNPYDLYTKTAERPEIDKLRGRTMRISGPNSCRRNWSFSFAGDSRNRPLPVR